MSLALALLAPVATRGTEVGLWDEIWFELTNRGQLNDTQFFFSVLTISVLLAAFAWRTWRLHQARTSDRSEPSKWLVWGNRLVSAALLVAALGSATQYFYGQKNDGVWLHRWDLYHQIIGAKYFSELSYFKIYECTWEVDEAHEGHFRRTPRMRDIETLRVLPTEKVIGERDCEQRFSPERWQAFAVDVDNMYKLGGNPDKRPRGMSDNTWHHLFGDKGFNGTPFHAWAISRLMARTPVEWKPLVRLALIDVGLMALAFGFVAWAWDVKTAAIAILFFCANFPNRFYHMGGSILRFDYVAMLIIALALMKKDRFAIAGVCVAWATAERVFPAVFAVGLAFKAGVELVLTRKLHRQYLYFGATFVGTLLVLFCCSLTLGDSVGAGLDNWADWWANMREHTRHTRGFRVGFKHMFMMDGNVTDKHGFVGFVTKTKLYEQHRPGALLQRTHFYYLTLLVVFAPLILAVRKLDAVSFTAIFCAAGFFCLTIATRYYYSVMVLFLLVDRKLFEDRKQLVLATLLMLTTAWLVKISVTTDHVAFHYNTASSAAFAGFWLILGAMLWMDPWLRDPGLPPRDPQDPTLDAAPDPAPEVAAAAASEDRAASEAQA